MSLADVLNLSRPRVVALGVAGAFTLVGLSLQLLRYNPPIWDACEGVTLAARAEDAQFKSVTEQYLRQTRSMSPGEYCIDKISTSDNERIVSVFRSGRRVGGGEGFQVRIDPATMTVIGEMAHE